MILHITVSIFLSSRLFPISCRIVTDVTHRAGKRLEPGFELVSVGNQKIEELRMLGIDYFERQNAARYVEDDDYNFED
jgi:hypothetical protein